MANPKVVLSDEDMEEIRQQFNEFDIDGNGHITTAELGACLKAAGEQVPGFKLREMVDQIDKNKNGTVEFDEFINMLMDIKASQVQYTFGKAISSVKGVSATTGKSHASATGTTHSYSEAETSAFVAYINNLLAEDPDCKKMLPIDPATHDIFKKVGDGILLCKMVNAAEPGTIDDRAINRKLTIYTRRENCTLAINSARSIGCSIVNIGAEDIIEGTEHLILGVMWQIIRIGLFAKIDLKDSPGLLNLLREGETIEDLQRLSPEELLMRWVNYHMEKAGSNRRITNFSGDIKDSEIYITLLERICPKDIALAPVPLTGDHTTRAKGMLENADRMEAKAFVTPRDVVGGNSKLNLAFVANLFNLYPALDPVEEMEELENIEETREEKTFRNWMNSLGVNPRVNYIYSDLCSGMVILQLYDIIKPGSVNWDKVNKPPYKQMGGKMKRIENCNYAVELGKEMKFSLVGIGGEDIHNGNKTLTLAIIWQAMRAYTLTILGKCRPDDDGKIIADEEIVQWANEKVAETEDAVKFRSFKDSSLSDSKFILKLIEAITPKSVNWENFINKPNDEEKMLNASYALSVARRNGAPIFALAEDIVEVKPKMLLTIFALLMALALSKQKKN